MGARDLPDMYARSLRDRGIHIRQITSAHVTSNMYAKQKHPGCKKVRGQSEAALQIVMCDQKL